MPKQTDAAPMSSQPETQLSHLLPALWKAVTRAAKGAERMPPVESQVSILRKLVDFGALAPAQLADELHLARPTISNLLRGLETEGLVERLPSDVDGRSVLVVPTDYGRQALLQFREGRVEVLIESLAALDPVDRDRIIQALPALNRLLGQLETIAERLPPEQQLPA